MIAKLQNPVLAAALGTAISVALGVSVAWKAIVPHFEQAAAAAAATRAKSEAPVEMKEKGWDFWTIEMDNLSAELKDERARLRKESEQLDQRAARLAAEEKELAKLRSDVDAVRKEVDDKMIEVKADEAKNFKTLAQTYTTLSPRAAVAIIKELDDTSAVKILSLMKVDVVGPIFETMSVTALPDGTTLAKRAATLSEKLRLMKAAKPTPPPA